MYKDEEYCSCENSSGVYSEWDGIGTWDYCDDCKKKIDGSLCYDDDPMIEDLM
ncbi:hypothetical protein [Bacillus sp. XF8]|uniref:hypothetical protein n=1 Tax=Bacillus sp. XF8 TaxID=2819289 RepID=UPI001AA01139|nr:hypothetical protein [Bacillus sp. XF8]MBO1582998.1 hypothetical protein [Bacillus sp. XF8]